MKTNNIDIKPLTQKGEGNGGVGTTDTALVTPGEVVAKVDFSDNTSTKNLLR